ncbi:MAG: hypothetical protein WKG07_19655 [Hymenobacter sp.]
MLRIWAVSSVQRLVRRGDISFPTLLVGSNRAGHEHVPGLAAHRPPPGPAAGGLHAHRPHYRCRAGRRRCPRPGAYQQLPALVRSPGHRAGYHRH